MTITRFLPSAAASRHCTPRARVRLRAGAAGFSLLEVLIALAITSLASLALFQSMSAWFAISAKTTGAAERALGGVVHNQQFRAVVGGLLPGWPYRPEEAFIGRADFFSGLTTASLHQREQGLAVVSMELLKDQRSGAITLSYAARAGGEDTGWIMERFPAATDGAFSYFGADGRWYPTWPPAKNPEPGPFTDAELFDTPPLPLAVKMVVTGPKAAGGTTATRTVLIAPVESDPILPIRPGDFL
ncbi:MAG: prepilin-type N-terminal cleavage/methylation domain-containing protein [Pseudomonadota bacterium]